MKKILLCIISLFLLFGSVSSAEEINNQTYNEEESQQEANTEEYDSEIDSLSDSEWHAIYNSNVKYTYPEEDVLVIEGQGALLGRRIKFYNENRVTEIKKIIIQEGVTSIGDSCFSRYYPMLESIEIPSSVNSIGEGAFVGCHNLKEIILPSGLTCIPNNCFRECYNLKEIITPDTVTSIGKDAFSYCENLETIVVSSELLTWKSPIKECPRLKKIVNNSQILLKLNDCKGKKTWYVDGEKVKSVDAGETAKAKGKKYKINYNLLGGKKSGYLPTSYRYGEPVKLPLNVKKKGYSIVAWSNNKENNGNFYHDSTSIKLSGNITLKPIWLKYKVENIKKNSIKVTINDKNAAIVSNMYDIRVSLRKDMKNSEYYSYYPDSDDKSNGIIRNLKKNKRYYVQIACNDIDFDSDEYGIDLWVGKRSVKIKR